MNIFKSMLLDPAGWTIVAFILMVAEFIIPGGIVFFLGVACLIVAGALVLGLVSTWMNALTLFFISSLALILSLRSFFARFASGDYTKANTDEILDDLDELVEVVEAIGPGDSVGRIQYRGTVWRALGDGSKINKGSMARIVARDNTTYIVEPQTVNVCAT